MNKILLVEDDHHLGIVIEDQLVMNGFEVRLLRFPYKTVENLIEKKFDIVILDKLLSGIDGTKICSDIRDTQGISHTPILMMSGFDGARKDCMDAGASNFIAKPFDMKNFIAIINETINNS